MWNRDMMWCLSAGPRFWVKRLCCQLSGKAEVLISNFLLSWPNISFKYPFRSYSCHHLFIKPTHWHYVAAMLLRKGITIFQLCRTLNKVWLSEGHLKVVIGWIERWEACTINIKLFTQLNCAVKKIVILCCRKREKGTKRKTIDSDATDWKQRFFWFLLYFQIWKKIVITIVSALSFSD